MNALTAQVPMALRHGEPVVSASPAPQLTGAAVRRSRYRPESAVSTWTPPHRPARPQAGASTSRSTHVCRPEQRVPTPREQRTSGFSVMQQSRAKPARQP